MEETSRTLQKFGYPLSQVERRIWAMKDAFQDACVRLASDPLKRVPLLPDSKDKHVVAAAMHSGAGRVQNVEVTGEARVKMLGLSAAKAVADWKFPEAAYGKNIQVTLEYKLNCPTTIRTDVN